MLDDAIVEYCKKLQESLSLLKDKESIRLLFIECCKVCNDINCVNNKDCIIKKTYCLIFDD